MKYNKQLADYTAKAFAAVPEGELIDRVEADNSATTSGMLGTMHVAISTFVLKPNEDNVTRRFYLMTSAGLVLTGQECEL